MANIEQSRIIQTIVNSIGEGVVATGLDDKIIFYNSAAIRIIGPDVSGYDASTWPSSFGIFLTDKVTPFPKEKVPLYLAARGSETDSVEMFIRNPAKPDGVFIEVSGRPIIESNAKISGGVIVIRDITERKRIEEQILAASVALHEKNIELVAVNKELESFSYAVSHDLRAPLRSIIGFSDALLKKASDKLSSEELDYLTRIKGSGDRLGQLIDGLLDLSRLTRGELRIEQFNLSEIVEGVASELKLESPNRVVHFAISPGITVKADQRLLRSVIQNLMGNAWKFSSKKTESKIEFGSLIIKDKKTYFVKDNGAGFSEKYSNKLFSIFQRLHSTQEFDGNGIGLATVQRIISRHGGTIWAEGKSNEGATFYFTL